MAPATRRTDASSSAAAAQAEVAAASVPRQLTEAEKDELRAELWDEFRNDHYESMEMLPLQLRRQSALLRELDEHASTELQRVQHLTRQYLELRTRLAKGDMPDSSEVNTRTLLAQIGAALNEYMRTAEEKVSIANNAYDSVDRHVRAMDGLIKEQDEVNNAGVRKVVFGYQQRPVTVTGHVEQEPEPAVVQKPTLDMPIDPNEPRYCLCQNVSYGEMIACDNGDDCPYEWFHYACVGLTEEPKGGAQWFCPDCKAKLSKRRK